MRIISIAIVLLLFGKVRAFNCNSATKSVTLTIRFKPGRPLHRFAPSHALGAAIDGDNAGRQDRKFTPANIQAMLSAGLKSLDYRLRTELAIDAWHWNPQGTWSDATRKQGYWTSDYKTRPSKLHSTSSVTNISAGASLPLRRPTES